MIRRSPSLRGKLLLVALGLLALPWAGVQYVREMETFLRQGQENALTGTARAVATVLHERIELFHSPPGLDEHRNPYAHPLGTPIVVDGNDRDWQPYEGQALHYDAAQTLPGWPTPESRDLSFDALLGVRGDYLYALFRVRDDQVLYRTALSTDGSDSDHLLLAFTDRQDRFHSFRFATTAPGWVEAEPLDTPEGTLTLAPRIHSEWRAEPDGYLLELRLPLAVVGSRIAYAVADVDDPGSRRVETLVGSADPRNAAALGGLARPSPEITAILRGLEHSRVRIRVVDTRRRVLAQAGSLAGGEEVPPPEEPPAAAPRRFLSALYRLILPQPATTFSDPLAAVARLDGPEVNSALEGHPATRWRTSSDGRVGILSATYPVRQGEAVLGAVVVEETNNAILTLQNRALENLLNISIAVLLAVIVVLFAFASRLSGRIRRLRDAAEQAIGSDGRVVATQVGDPASGDEIGDLARSFGNVLTRLQQYTRYLEGMAGRLSHELRTPLAVVRSSLENLELTELPTETRVYTERAREGVTRLGSLLTRMSEATRLEQTLQQAERERFDLRELVAGCAAGYRDIYPQQAIACSLPEAPQWLTGVPDLINQMLDKLVANAVEFSDGSEPVRIALTPEREGVQLSVENSGPPLPAEMGDRLFDSMVSIRPPRGTAPHLGLGLYIVRLVAEFHGGRVHAENRSAASGARFSVRLPYQPT